MEKLTERQNQILDSTLSLISEGGIQAVTIKNLSSKIGVVESAIYRHFRNKSEILEALLIRFNDQSSKMLDRLKEIESSGLKLLERFILMRFKKIADDPANIAFIFSEKYFLNDIVLQNRINDNMDFIQKGLIEIIQSAQNNGEIRKDIDAHYLSQIIMGSIRFTATKWRLSNYSFNLFDEGKDVWNTIKKMIERKTNEFNSNE